MPRKCSVLGCRFSLLPNVTFSTFKFPPMTKYPKTFQLWMKFCKLEQHEIGPNSAICAGHFSNICFNYNNSRKTLKAGSIPTIFDPELCSMDMNSSFVDEESISSTHSHQQSVTFEEIKHFCLNSVNSSNFSCQILPNGSILLYILELVEPYTNIISFSISYDKSVKFFSRGKELQRNHFLSYFSKPYFITCMEQLKLLVEYISSNFSCLISSSENSSFDLEKVILEIDQKFECKEIISFFFSTTAFI